MNKIAHRTYEITLENNITFEIYCDISDIDDIIKIIGTEKIVYTEEL